jgi:hypothetical protein
MLKISNSLREIASSDNLLKAGLYHRLLNLSKTARFLKPLIETRTKKPVGFNALLMNLSRLQGEIGKSMPKIQDFSIINLTVYSELCSMAFVASPKVLNNIHKIQTEIQKQDGYLTLSQGTSEVTIITNEKFIDLVTSILGEKPKYIKKDLSSLGLKFDAKYNDLPGWFYYVVQSIALQGVSIHEISSTYTELILYIDKKDIKLSFDTIQNLFAKEKDSLRSLSI